MEAFQVSLIIGLGFAIAEVVTGTFILLSIGISMGIVALVQFSFGGYSINRDLILLTIGSIVFSVVFRRYFKTESDTKIISSDGDVNTY